MTEELPRGANNLRRERADGEDRRLTLEDNVSHAILLPPQYLLKVFMKKVTLTLLLTELKQYPNKQSSLGYQ